jgi:hypothetical protein
VTSRARRVLRGEPSLGGELGPLAMPNHASFRRCETLAGSCRDDLPQSRAGVLSLQE